MRAAEELQEGAVSGSVWAWPNQVEQDWFQLQNARSGIGRNPSAKLPVGAGEHRRTVHETQGFELLRGELAQAVTRLREVFSGSGKLHPAEVYACVCRNENAAPSLEVERDLTCTMAGNVEHTQIGRKRKAVAFL